MQNVPVLDQGNLPICYAFSAAEMLQTWRCSHGALDCKNKQVSPVSIAVNAELLEVNHKTVQVTGPTAKDSLFWGYNRDQISAATLFQGPFCDQGALQSISQTNELQTDIDHLFKQYKQKCVNAVSLFGNISSPDTASCRLMDTQPLDHASFEFLAKEGQDCFSQLGLGAPVDLKQVEAALVNSDPLLLIQGQIVDTCKTHSVPVPSMPPLDFYDVRPTQGGEVDTTKTSEVKNAINSEFDKMGKAGQPIFVGYCADVLSAGRSYIPAFGKNCSAAHASLIIGRREDPKKPGVCQYLVRNSWGKSCDRKINDPYSYHSDWECDTDKGDYWIDQDVMLKATMEVGGVENEGIGGLIPSSNLSSSTR